MPAETQHDPFSAGTKNPVRRTRGGRDWNFADGNIVGTVPTGRIAVWDEVAEGIFGYKPTEVLGQPLTILVPEERHDELPWILERIAKGKMVDGYETVRKRKDGTPIRVFLRVAPVVGGSRKIIGASATVRNLSVAHAVPDARDVAAQARWELMEEAPFGAVYFDLDGKLEYANRAVTRLLGCRTREELLSLNAKTEIFDCVANFEQFLAQNASTEGFRSTVAEWRTRDGKATRVRLHSRMVRRNDREGQGCVVFVLDQTGGKKPFEQPAGESQTMEALGRLARGVAHDFNNVLGVMLGYAQLLRTAPDEKRQANVEQILRAGNQARLLTRRLQAFGHVQTRQARLIDLNERIGALCGLLQPTMNPGIELVVRQAARPCKIWADGAVIDQVVIELAEYAQKMMTDKGTLTVKVSSLDRGSVPKPLPVGCYVRLSVSDTGRGMDADEIEHVFEPFFFPADRRRNGNGLELATVYGMVKQNGGYILISSQSGYGTTFTIYFPQADETTDEPTWLPRSEKP